MRRVAIVGCPGSGKSTLARQLGPRLDLPVIHLDRHFWAPGWKPAYPDRDAWRAAQLELLSGDSWLVDGNYGSTIDLRLSLADTVVFLDVPKRICLTRVVRRQLRHEPRPDLPPECPERFDPGFLLYVMRFSRSRVMQAIAQHATDADVLHLRSPGETRALLASLPHT